MKAILSHLMFFDDGGGEPSLTDVIQYDSIHFHTHQIIQWRLVPPEWGIVIVFSANLADFVTIITVKTDLMQNEFVASTKHNWKEFFFFLIGIMSFAVKH